MNTGAYLMGYMDKKAAKTGVAGKLINKLKPSVKTLEEAELTGRRLAGAPAKPVDKAKARMEAIKTRSQQALEAQRLKAAQAAEKHKAQLAALKETHAKQVAELKNAPPAAAPAAPAEEWKIPEHISPWWLTGIPTAGLGGLTMGYAMAPGERQRTG
jgi:hypothetical protein